MEERGVHRGGENGQARCALCVMSCLLVVIGIMLPYVLSPPQPPVVVNTHQHDPDPKPLKTPSLPSADASADSRSTGDVTPKTTSSTEQAWHEAPKDDRIQAPGYVDSIETLTVQELGDTSEDNSNADDVTSEVTSSDDVPADVPYEANKVTIQPLDSQSFSLTGGQCSDDRCSSEHDDVISDVLVASDKRVVVSLFYKKALFVDSSSGVQTLSLPCHPKALTELPDGIIAVTCYFTASILFVNTSSHDQPVQQSIQTEKLYRHVTFNPKGNTLFVSFRSEEPSTILHCTNSVDVITMTGKVVKTFIHSGNVDMDPITSLTVVRGELIVTNNAGKILRIELFQKDRRLGVHILTYNPSPKPLKAVGDGAGNIFMVTENTVLLRNKVGTYRRLLEVQKGEGYVFENMALHEDRLLLVTRVVNTRRTRLTQYLLL